MERLKNNCVSGPFFLFRLPSLPENRILGAPRGAARRSADPARRSSRSSTPWTRRRRRPRPCRTSDRARVHMDSSCLDAMRVGTHGQDAKERSRNMERFEPFTLGQCPFCNGGVTAAVRRFDERTIGMWYVAFDYDLRPGCPNGCPIDRFDTTRLFFDGWTVASDYDPTPAFRRAWARDVRMFHMRPPARGADGSHGCAPAPISPWAARGADCGRSRSAATNRSPSCPSSRRGAILWIRGEADEVRDSFG